MMKDSEKVKDFWNARANLKEKAGTQDLIAKWLEIQTLAGLCHKYLDDKQKNRRILDVGCGNGMTLIHLAKEMSLEAEGIDYAVEMVKEARESWKKSYGSYPLSMIDFQVGDVLEMQPSDFAGKFDLIYTERTLINLGTWEAQLMAVQNILKCLRKGGRYIMLENSVEGLTQINVWREMVGLPVIVAPWHNRYLRDGEVEGIKKLAMLEKVVNYSATYYFLSRIINAKLAVEEGEEPDYLSAVNKLAMDLPPLPGFLGQGRVWVWRKM